eukprot:TRINITY_DN9474_c0_g5_i1.p1 TRINITY_DN9474_c0_g5~~TRINITY_DN9474_c0_g5_i1.p1  ORF type:complete len:859 (+),score=296.64 TRINITY_DN9474_c0_g5_i1:77-2578(+)
MPPPPAKRAETATTISITLILVVATVVSALASLAGGLVMYQESLRSLEKTVQETSQSELLGVSVSIMNIVDAAREDGDVLREALYMSAPATQQGWSDFAKVMALSFLKTKASHYCIGVVGVPHDGAPNDAFYTALWTDPINGSRTYTAGFHHDGVPDIVPEPDPAFKGEVNGSAATGYLVDTPSYAVHPNGTLGEQLYTWNSEGSVFAYLKMDAFDAADADKDGVLGRQHRGHEAWFSADRTLYAYSGFDTVYAPPPAPHPLSHLKGVGILSLFHYESWAEALEEYRAGVAPGTDIVIMDAKTKDVIATTTGERMVDQTCFDNAPDGAAELIDSCSLKLAGMSATVQQVYAGLDGDGAEFMKIETASGELFARKAPLYNDVVLLWMRPTSTIQDRVHAALVLLLAFTALVFALNVLVGAVEIWFIAKPMREIAAAVVCIGSMNTAAAEDLLLPQLGKGFMVSECQALVVHLHATIENLVQFRSYMPQSILLQNDLSGSESDGSRASGSISGGTNQWSSQDSRATKVSKFTASAAQQREASRSLLDTHLVHKKFAYLSMNTHGFLTMPKKHAESKCLLGRVEELVSTVVDALRAHHGVLEHFSGDRFHGSFGGSLPASSAETKALGAACLLRTRVAATLGLRTSVGVLSASGYIGNAGTQGMRKFMYLSPKVSLAAALMDFAKTLGGTVLTATRHEGARNLMYAQRLVGWARYEKVCEGRLDVLEVMEKITFREDSGEWMYELVESDGCYAVWDAFARAVMGGEHAAAGHHISGALDVDRASAISRYYQAMYREQAAYRVVDLDRPWSMERETAVLCEVTPEFGSTDPPALDQP